MKSQPIKVPVSITVEPASRSGLAKFGEVVGTLVGSMILLTVALATVTGLALIGNWCFNTLIDLFR